MTKIFQIATPLEKHCGIEQVIAARPPGPPGTIVIHVFIV